MASITTTVATITKMVIGRMELFLLDNIFGLPTLHSVRHLIEQLAIATTKWGGKHRLLLLILSKSKMRLDARNNNLNYERLKKPELINPRIEDITQGQELLQFQTDQNVEW